MKAYRSSVGTTTITWPRWKLTISIFAFIPPDDQPYMDSCLELYVSWGRWWRTFHIKTENKRGIRLPDEQPATYTY